MNKLFLLLPLTLLSGLAFAQKKNVGYVVTLQNDTLRGSIEEKDNYHHSTEVVFTAEGTTQSKTYQPTEVTAYGIGSDVVYASQDLRASFLNGRFFSKRLLKGYASLYEATPKRGKTVYILQKPDGTLVALEEKVYFGLLKLHLGDCPEIQFNEKDLSTYRYRENGLIKLLTRYNQCKSPQTAQVRLKNQFPVTYGVIAGASLNQYRSQNDILVADFGRKLSPNLGAFLGFSIGRHAGVEVQAQYQRYSGNILYKTTPWYGDHTYKFQMDLLSASLLFRYFFLDKFYLSPGANLNYTMSQQGTERIYNRDREFKPSPSALGFGYMVGAGTRLRLLGKQTLVEARYNIGTVLNGPNQEAKISSIQALLQMNLAKKQK